MDLQCWYPTTSCIFIAVKTSKLAKLNSLDTLQRRSERPNLNEVRKVISEIKYSVGQTRLRHVVFILLKLYKESINYTTILFKFGQMCPNYGHIVEGMEKVVHTKGISL